LQNNKQEIRRDKRIFHLKNPGIEKVALNENG
jgi:hypothetical protein